MREVTQCTIGKFTEGQCGVEMFADLKDNLMGFEAVRQFIENTGCDVPDDMEPTLPDGYGGVQPLECAVTTVCHLDQVSVCVALFDPTSSGDCK